MTEYVPLIKYNLQFFANDDKTEEPTAKKISDTREEGQVAKSTEISSAIALMTAFIFLRFFMGFLSGRLLGVFHTFWQNIHFYANDDMTPRTVWQLFLNVILYFFITILPALIIFLIVGFMAQRVQIKWKVTTKPLQPKLSKLNPINGFKRLFSARALISLLLSIVKIVLFGYISYSVIKDNIGLIINSYDFNIEDNLGLLFDIIFELGIKISAVYLILGVADLFYQRWKFKQEIKMTKQEVKDEYKNQEGDPKVKGQQRQRMQQASRRRMMQSVPEADVVITNPTHFAVALKYDNTLSQAPLVVAKGADYLAYKIKDIAKENDVEIVENKPLARMLYSNVEVGDEIPPELYQSVAEVLAYVYRIKNKVS
ncbi:MAG: flagellar biosynthesis protein FlhB [Lachnospiraceae bacterium]|nr:flagellar biosynthesis protein FlhB [Lachnospiraceae bacterium]